MKKSSQYYKVLIAGGRDFTNFSLLKESVDNLLVGKADDVDIVIISGVAEGADMLGERYACEIGYEVEEFPVELTQIASSMWSRYKEMIKTADECICFWDGKSEGTKQLIDLAGVQNINLTVINY